MINKLYESFKDLGIFINKIECQANQYSYSSLFNPKEIYDISFSIHEDQLRNFVSFMEASKVTLEKEKINSSLIANNEVVKQAYEQFSIILALQGGVV